MHLIRLNVFLLAVVLSGIISCNKQEIQTEDLKKFNKLGWLENSWEGSQGNAKIHETWFKKNFRVMKGASYTINNSGQRVFSQEMEIEQNYNRIYYKIKHSGNNSEVFDLVSETDTSAVFKNEGNNYPSFIKYKLDKNNSMSVFLQGSSSGTEMNTVLKYEKD